MLVSEAIGQDHKYLDECYENLKSANGTDDKIKRRNILTWNLARHAISEELQYTLLWKSGSEKKAKL
jgi:hypothetical protein